MSTHFPRAASRREFLFRSGGGLGGIALNYLLARDAATRGADAPRSPGTALPDAGPLHSILPKLRAEGQARHLPVHGRRAQPDGPVRPQACAREVGRQTAAGVDRPAQEPVHQRRGGDSTQHPHVPEARAERRRDFRPPAAPRHLRRRHLLPAGVLVQQHRARPGDVRAAQRAHPDGLAEPRQLGHLRARQRQREPAGVLRHAAAGGRAGGRRPVLVERVPPAGAPGHAAPPRSEPDHQFEAADRHGRGAEPAAVRAGAEAERGAGRRGRGARGAHRGTPPTPSTCRRRARRRSAPTGWTARRRPTSARGCCWPGGWWSGACGS